MCWRMLDDNCTFELWCLFLHSFVFFWNRISIIYDHISQSALRPLKNSNILHILGLDILEVEIFAISPFQMHCPTLFSQCLLRRWNRIPWHYIVLVLSCIGELNKAHITNARMVHDKLPFGQSNWYSSSFVIVLSRIPDMSHKIQCVFLMLRILNRIHLLPNMKRVYSKQFSTDNFHKQYEDNPKFWKIPFSHIRLYHRAA